VSEHRPGSHGDGVGRETKPVPRDMPDQQAGADGDPWEPATDAPRRAEAEQPDPQVPDGRVPDTDEAGTGRRGSPRSGSPRPEHPVPDEPSG
jgi:hypothetical protein